jgi:hypothetical protein
MRLQQLVIRMIFAGCLGTTISIGAVSVWAQITTKTVSAGQETTLLDSKQKIDLKTAPKKGVARVETLGQGEGQLYKLNYKANDTAEKTTDELTYAADNGPAQILKIDIEPGTPGVYETGFRVLFLLFVLAVILESALAILFNWRPFVETFNARAVRPLISFIVAYFFVHAFSLDLVTTFINAAMTHDYGPNIPGKILTALVLAGGSAGVNNLLVALGYRQQKTPETVTPKPPPNTAWIAVRVRRQQASGPVQVFIGVKPDANTPPPLVGVIAGSSRPGLRYFLSDPGRFPGYGGHSVPANTQTSVELVDGTAPNPVTKNWGPYTVAGGAIIDLEFTM